MTYGPSRCIVASRDEENPSIAKKEKDMKAQEKDAQRYMRVATGDVAPLDHWVAYIDEEECKLYGAKGPWDRAVSLIEQGALICVEKDDDGEWVEV